MALATLKNLLTDESLSDVRVVVLDLMNHAWSFSEVEPSTRSNTLARRNRYLGCGDLAERASDADTLRALSDARPPSSLRSAALI